MSNLNPSDILKHKKNTLKENITHEDKQDPESAWMKRPVVTSCGNSPVSITRLMLRFILGKVRIYNSATE